MYNAPSDYLKARPPPPAPFTHTPPLISRWHVTRVHASPLPPHQSFRFSIVIENIKADFYFSAKLINCFVHATVPVYWGAPSIAVFFNVSGMIVFDTLEEVSGGRLWGWSHACC